MHRALHIFSKASLQYSRSAVVRGRIFRCEWCSYLLECPYISHNMSLYASHLVETAAVHSTYAQALIKRKSVSCSVCANVQILLRTQSSQSMGKNNIYLRLSMVHIYNICEIYSLQLTYCQYYCHHTFMYLLHGIPK